LSGTGGEIGGNSEKLGDASLVSEIVDHSREAETKP
jgi:hypothetical protein